MGKMRAPSASDFAFQIDSLRDTEAIALRARGGAEYPKVTIYAWEGGWNMFLWSGDRRYVGRKRDYDAERIVESAQGFLDSVALEEAEVRFPER